MDVVNLHQSVDWPPKRWSDGCPPAALVVGIPLLEFVLVVCGHLHNSEEVVGNNPIKFSGTGHTASEKQTRNSALPLQAGAGKTQTKTPAKTKVARC